MSESAWVDERTFEKRGDGRPTFLLAWQSVDGFWRWQHGYYSPDSPYAGPEEGYWTPNGHGIAATRERAEAECREAAEMRTVIPYSLPEWARGEYG